MTRAKLPSMSGPSRRSVLRAFGAVPVAAGGLLAMPGTANADALDAGAATSTDARDPDGLFRAGEFKRADRGYERILHADPDNAHAWARRGYIALLSNRFDSAEVYLSRAIDLDGDDIDSVKRLAECFVRQDQHGRAIPLLRGTGNDNDAALAEQFAHLGDEPWQVRGAPATRVPFEFLDPLPTVAASVNGGEPKRFLIDTFGMLNLTKAAADEMGLSAVAAISGGIVGGRPVTIHLGRVDSFRIGDLEFRDIPMQWIDADPPPLPDGSTPAGVIGTLLLYHALATMDYAGQELVLRRTTDDQRRDFHSEAVSARLDRLPLWLAGDHFPCTLGSLNHYGPRIVTLDTGGIGHSLETLVSIAEHAGTDVDYDNPQDHNGVAMYPIHPDRISLGRAIGHDVPGCLASEEPVAGMPGPAMSDMLGFDVIANFTHGFFTPFAITFDYTDMNLYIG